MSKKGLFYIDRGLFIPCLILILINLITLFSLNINLFKNELLFVFVGLVVFFIFSQVHYKIPKLYGTPIYIISLILLVAVLIIGVETRGSLRWIEIFGFRFQFSEILKPFLGISLASYLAENSKRDVKSFAKVLLFMAPIAFLIFIQPDLGDALIYVFVTVLALVFAGFSWYYFAILISFFALITPLAWNFLHDYQKNRVLTFLDPSRDPLGKSYNAIQSMIAIGSGMFLGKGLGQGSQSGLRFLPERHTDFIFATISEQTGFIGSFLVIICFIFLFYRIIKISFNSNDKFSKFYSSICFFILLMQFFINVGMNVGILPIVGVTLPFVSYGGSSMLSNFILLGLLVSISRSIREDNVLEIG